jgi:hypothetical protein
MREPHVLSRYIKCGSALRINNRRAKRVYYFRVMQTSEASECVIPDNPRVLVRIFHKTRRVYLQGLQGMLYTLLANDE